MLRGRTDLMADIVLVVLLLVIILAAVLVPPAAGARASREAEFLGSLRPGGHPHESDALRPPDPVDHPRFRPALTANARRRQVLGGLVVAVGATLLLGLLPPFRLLLVVHLLLVNSCLAYVGLLVHVRDTQTARARALTTAGWRVRPATSSALPAEVHPYASAGTVRFEDADHRAYWAEESYEGEWGASGDGFAYASRHPGDDEAGYDGGYSGYGYGGYETGFDSEYEGGYEMDGADEAEAAFVDDEVALDLAQPA